MKEHCKPMNRAIYWILITAMIVWAAPGMATADGKAPALIADATANPSSGAETQESKTAENAPPPAIMIPDPLFTFDPVVDGSEVVHDFRVYNRGKGELKIEKVQTG